MWPRRPDFQSLRFAADGCSSPFGTFALAAFFDGADAFFFAGAETAGGSVNRLLKLIVLLLKLKKTISSCNHCRSTALRTYRLNCALGTNEY